MHDRKSVSRGKEGVHTGGDVAADTEAGGRVFGGANNRAAENARREERLAGQEGVRTGGDVVADTALGGRVFGNA